MKFILCFLLCVLSITANALIAPVINNSPMYLANGGVGGAVSVVTPPNSSTATQWLIHATGAGGGARKNHGGGGAGGTVTLALTNIPANTRLDFVIGAPGLGSDTPGGTGTPTNGGDTNMYIGTEWQFTAMGGLTPNWSTGGGPGGDPTFNGSSSYIITYSGHMTAGGDGGMWDGAQGFGGTSYWGGGNYGGSGGADGAGGGATTLAGWVAGCGVVELTRISN